MKKKSVVEIITRIKAVYPYTFKNATQEELALTVNTWQEALSSYPEDLVQYAFKEAIKACKMPPTIADVIEQIEKVKSAQDKSDGELWTEYLSLLHAARDLSEQFRYTFVPGGGNKTQGQIAREKLNRLWENADERIKEYCGSVDNLISTAKSDDWVYEKSRFLKGIGNCRKRVEVKKEVPQIFIEMTKNIKLIDDVEDIEF